MIERYEHKPHVDSVHLCYYLMFPSINDRTLSSWAQGWHRAAVTTTESLTYARLSARGPSSKVKCHMLSIPTCRDRARSTRGEQTEAPRGLKNNISQHASAAGERTIMTVLYLTLYSYNTVNTSCHRATFTLIARSRNTPMYYGSLCCQSTVFWLATSKFFNIYSTW